MPEGHDTIIEVSNIMSFVLYTQILKQSVLKPASPGITLSGKRYQHWCVHSPYSRFNSVNKGPTPGEGMQRIESGSPDPPPSPPALHHRDGQTEEGVFSVGVEAFVTGLSQISSFFSFRHEVFSESK